MKFLAEEWGVDVETPDKDGLLPIHHALKNAAQNGQDLIEIGLWWSCFRYDQQSKERSWH